MSTDNGNRRTIVAGTDEQIIEGSGDVFHDVGVPNGQEDLVKAHIALAITNTLRKRGLTQAEAAKMLRTDQAKISAILRGRLKGISTSRLFRYLTLLGRDVEVRISGQSATDRPGRIRVYG
jgi:predicted XRE-type DNA-binding protein